MNIGGILKEPVTEELPEEYMQCSDLTKEENEGWMAIGKNIPVAAKLKEQYLYLWGGTSTSEVTATE